jgi:uncharacterized membrane protein SpoIIM required for sporulation
MILDLKRFVEEERPFWAELDRLLGALERRKGGVLSLEEARRLHYLHARVASDLARLATFSGEEALLRELEGLVARAHAEVHAAAGRGRWRLRPMHWLRWTFPRAFRRRWGFFAASCALFAAGALFGMLALAFDPESKAVLIPFDHLEQTPSERVASEERNAGKGGGSEATFSAYLMTHNTRVSILSMALGSTYGVGTGVLLFYNGAILGAVCLDYVRDGQAVFLTAWLLPHGSIEIPALLIAGQAGLLLASALIGGRGRETFRQRMKDRGPDLVSLICGVTLLLVWAGVVEAFLSQLHAPVVPYWVKILFGAVSLALLAAYLGFAGRGPQENGGAK